MSHLAYQLSIARIDELRRQAAAARRAGQAANDHGKRRRAPRRGHRRVSASRQAYA
jgi:hypothetical protein